MPSPEPDMEPESGCASNRMGATPAQQPAREEGDAVKRDLFRWGASPCSLLVVL